MINREEIENFRQHILPKYQEILKQEKLELERFKERVRLAEEARLKKLSRK